MYLPLGTSKDLYLTVAEVGVVPDIQRCDSDSAVDLMLVDA